MCRNQEIPPISASLFLRYIRISNLLRLWDTLRVVPLVQLRVEPLLLGRSGHAHRHVSIPVLLLRGCVRRFPFRFIFRLHPTETDRKSSKWSSSKLHR
ncbi:MAG: hypothetical protein J6386_24955 [Candidatus Synoicihabitans palmerolidicus]|nr:hypothetical protein [Candidatus Synoicihabitans palmerolidicus]